MNTHKRKARFSNKMIVTKTIVKPKSNSDFFEFEEVEYKRDMTPFEKSWTEYQKNTKKKNKRKIQSNKQLINSDKILHIMLGILAIVIIINTIIK